MTITLFTKPSCVQCEATKRRLDKLGIDYTTVDVTKDPAAFDHIVGLGYQQVPVVEVKRSKKKDESWAGYRPDLLAGLKGAA